jgi:hypothetical protein
LTVARTSRATGSCWTSNSQGVISTRPLA